MKRRFGSSEAYGKEEFLQYLLSGMDGFLKNEIVKYACDTAINSLTLFKKDFGKKIDDSDLGFWNIVKGFIKEGDSFDMNNLLGFDFDEFDDNLEKYERELEAIESFISKFSNTSNEHLTTKNEIKVIREAIKNKTNECDKVIEAKINEKTSGLESDNLKDIAKSFFKVGGMAVNLKGFFKGEVYFLIDSIILEIEKIKKCDF